MGKEILDDTKAQLDADEAFFATTKASCQTKADEWSTRVRLRTEELQGIAKCIQILSSPDAQGTFQKSATTLLQLSSEATPRRAALRKGPSAAFFAMKTLATRFKSTRFARIAMQLEAGGHFDKVMASIDSMIELLRREEQADIEHRDRCQGAENKNDNDKEDLNHDISKAATKIGALEQDIGSLEGEISVLEGAIAQTKTDRAERLTLRNEEVAEFRQAMKDDTDAAELLSSAMAAIKEFYRRNKLPLALKAKADPEYTTDKDKAPKTSWSGSNYGGRKSETYGIVAILEILKEDGEMKESLDKQIALKMSKEKELAENKGEKFDTEEHKAAKEDDLVEEGKLESAIYSDCSWVATHFDSRRTKRKAEMEGLQEAKSYLAGVESGDVI